MLRNACALRKGLFDTGKQHKHLIDIVITHYMSPWSLGKPWFDILSLQRGIDFSEFGVILVSDGEGSRLDDSLFADYPFEVRNITIPHGGVQASRNAGIDNADADWIMICDFDDTLLSVNSMYYALEAARNSDGKVMLVSKFIEEFGKDGKVNYVDADSGIIFNHGKLYRLDWLNEEGIRFHEKLSRHEDVYFNTLIQAIVNDEQVGIIKKPFFMWCYNKDSVSRSTEDWQLTTYPDKIRQRIAINREFKRRGLDGSVEYNTVTTIAEGYYEFQQMQWFANRLKKKVETAERWFSTFVREYWEIYSKVDPVVLAQVMRKARDRQMDCGTFLMEMMTFREFISHIVNDVRPIPKEEWGL